MENGKNRIADQVDHLGAKKSTRILHLSNKYLEISRSCQTRLRAALSSRLLLSRVTVSFEALMQTIFALDTSLSLGWGLGLFGEAELGLEQVNDVVYKVR